MERSVASAAAFVLGGLDNLSEEVRRAVVRVFAARRDLAPRPMTHTCRPALCSPMSEVDFMRRRVLDPPAINPAVYLCRYGQVHLCTGRPEDGCVEQALSNGYVACGVSGRVMGPQFEANFNPEDEIYGMRKMRRNNPPPEDTRPAEAAESIVASSSSNGDVWYAGEIWAKKRQVYRQRQSKTKVSPAVGRVRTIGDSTYATTIRCESNAIFEHFVTSPKRHKLESERARSFYRAARQRAKVMFARRCSILEVYMEISTKYFAAVVARNVFASDGSLLVNAPRVANMLFLTVFHCSRILCDVWSTVKLQTFVVSIFYVCKSGLRFRGVTVVPQYPFLRKCLPDEMELNFFGVPKNNVNYAYRLLMQRLNKLSKDDDLDRVSFVKFVQKHTASCK